MKVADILREKGTRIITVGRGEPVTTAARLMATEKIGALVVKDVVSTEGDTCVGVLSERDIVRGLVEFGPAVMQFPVEKLMTGKLISCARHDDLSSVMDKMDHHGIRHLPVLEDFTLIGVISVRDVIGALRSQMTWNEATSAA
jgi:CBS domain-containing protein